MAREVRHDEKRPAIFDEDDLGDDGKLFICRCGLSSDKPLCDGSHKATADEEDGVLYKYDSDDDDTERHVIEDIIFADE